MAVPQCLEHSKDPAQIFIPTALASSWRGDKHFGEQWHCKGLICHGLHSVHSQPLPPCGTQLWGQGQPLWQRISCQDQHCRDSLPSQHCRNPCGLPAPLGLAGIRQNPEMWRCCGDGWAAQPQEPPLPWGLLPLGWLSPPNKSTQLW